MAALTLCLAPWALAQSTAAPAPAGPPAPSGPEQNADQAAPLTLTLEDALQRARVNNPLLHAAVIEAGIAREQKVQDRAALLPAVNYNAEYLYTQGNGTPSGRFIANNGVHEYLSQGNVHQVLDPALFVEYRRSSAAAALAKARAEVAARGLVVTVVQSYYGLVVAQRKYATAQDAAAEAQRFLGISQALERGGEVAHSDVIKAQLQANDRQIDFLEARVAMEKARLTLAVLLFTNFEQNFSVVDDLRLPPPLPSLAEIRQMTQPNNPDLRAALAAVRVANQDAAVAWMGYLPSMSFDYFYGVDASHLATRTGSIQNLGYAASATLHLPIWNWGATQSKVRQAGLKRQLARLELSFAQRQLLANLHIFYGEAEAARSVLETLRDSAELAAESLRLTNLRYQAGEVSVLEVVDAQNTLTQARNAYDDGEARYRVALATLQTLTGRY
ncbi:MAG: TolC family protein [Acidobacteriota bacterium]|nr:TolC family protein [Acidobacteriota bacterium]